MESADRESGKPPEKSVRGYSIRGRRSGSKNASFCSRTESWRFGGAVKLEKRQTQSLMMLTGVACRPEHAAGSRLRKSRRAGGRLRSREEKDRLERSSAMPKKKTSRSLAQECWASRFDQPKRERFQVTLNLGVLPDPELCLPVKEGIRAGAWICLNPPSWID